MNERRPAVLDVLSLIHASLIFAAVYPFLAGLLGFSGSTFLQISAAGVLMLLPVTASFLLNRKIKSLILFFLLGASITTGCSYLAWCWGGRESYSGFVCGAATGIGSAIIFGLRIYTKVLYGKTKHEFYAVHSPDTPFELKGRQLPSPLNSPKLYHLLWFSALYVLDMLLHHKTSLYILFGMVFVDIFVCLSYQYISALYDYVSANRRLASLPLSSMHRIHRLLGIAGALLLTLFLLPGLLYGREFDPRLPAREPVQNTPPVMQQGNNRNYAQEKPDTEIVETSEPQKPAPRWIPVLLRVFGCIVAFAIAVFTIVLLFHIIRSLEKEFSVADEEDEVIFLKKGKVNDEIETSGTGRTEGFFSRRQQIRRQYRRIIKKKTKGTPSFSATPAQLEETAALSGTPGMKELHESYEKARYDKP